MSQLKIRRINVGNCKIMVVFLKGETQKGKTVCISPLCGLARFVFASHNEARGCV